MPPGLSQRDRFSRQRRDRRTDQQEPREHHVHMHALSSACGKSVEAKFSVTQENLKLNMFSPVLMVFIVNISSHAKKPKNEFILFQQWSKSACQSLQASISSVICSELCPSAELYKEIQWQFSPKKKKKSLMAPTLLILSHPVNKRCINGISFDFHRQWYQEMSNLLSI